VRRSWIAVDDGAEGGPESKSDERVVDEEGKNKRSCVRTKSISMISSEKKSFSIEIGIQWCSYQ